MDSASEVKYTSYDDGKYLLVAAIDFGTTFSGYAFSPKPLNPDEDIKIIANKNWGASIGFASHKTATSVLVSKSTGKLKAFGYEAETEYTQLDDDDDENGKPEDLLLFRQFKMILQHRENVRLDAPIHSLEGTLMPAVDIFANAIKFLKGHMLDAIKAQNVSLPPNEMIRWVITVPAIWSDQSKQFMREAAFRAGCVENKDAKNLLIALEPEAASLCCRTLQVAKYDDTQGIGFPAGTKYLILDCGGGTIDVTMHKMHDEKTVKEIIRPSGGPWGGTQVDKNFIKLLEEIFGENFIRKFQQNNSNSWLSFLTSFERTKKSFRPDDNRSLVLQVPFALGSFFAEMHDGKGIDKFLKEKGDKRVNFRQGNLTITHETVKGFFDPVVEKIVDHTSELLTRREAKDLDYILMVGGFSECEFLQHAMKERFERNGLKILIPNEAQLAIIKGAVLYGHRPSEIGYRIARYSYGYRTVKKFDPEIHDSKYKAEYDGVEKCIDIFACFVKQGEEIKLDTAFRKKVKPVAAGMNDLVIEIFTKDGIPDEPVEYTDSEGMRRVGEVQLHSPGDGSDRIIEISFVFGGSEFKVHAQDVGSGNKEETVIDFLTA